MRKPVISVSGGYVIRVIDGKTGKVVKEATRDKDLIVQNGVNLFTAIIEGGSLNLKDVNGNSYSFQKVDFTKTDAMAGSGDSSYGIVIGADGSVSFSDYSIISPLTGIDFSYGACSEYTNTCSSSGWCNQLGIERKITYLGSGTVNVSCIGLICKISGYDASGNSISSKFLLIKDKTSLSVQSGYILDAKVFVTVNPLG